MRTNAVMQRYLSHIANVELPAHLLTSPQVVALFASLPLATGDGTLVLPWTPQGATIPRDHWADRTGYECFVNHVHLESVLGEDCDVSLVGVKLGLALGEHLAVHLADAGPVTIIVSFDGASPVLRVHRTRPGERWLADDLEGYAEGVLVIETAPPYRERPL